MLFSSPFSYLLLFILGFAQCYIQCLDNSGEIVDWYFVYKSNEGTDYSYYDASSTVNKLTPSTTQTLDAGSNSCIEQTLNQIYSNKKDINYVAYNDEFPNGTWSSSSGHTKGVLAFDDTNEFKGGFWLIHAVPKFPNLDASTYEFASNGWTYGQNFLCISMNTITDIDLSVQQIRYNSPFVYATNELDDQNMENFNSLVLNQWLTGISSVNLTSIDGQLFTHLTRSGSMNTDIFEDIISPYYYQSFEWQTWLHTNAESIYCTPDYKYDEENIKKIVLGNGWYITNGEDHSKFGIGLDSDDVVCMGDLNRATSQNDRGGGYACMRNDGLYTAIKNVIVSVDTCKLRE